MTRHDPTATRDPQAADRPAGSRRLGRGPRRRWLLPAVALVGLLLAGVLGWVLLAPEPGRVGRVPATPSPSASPSPTGTVPVTGSNPIPPPATGTWVGAWVKPAVPNDPAASIAAVTALENALGRRLAIDNHYYKWALPWPTAAESSDLASGRIPLVSWGGTDPARIASGADDALIRARAAAAKALGAPFFLRWAWEMDAKPKGWDPAQFVAAWRHVRDLFRAAGVQNAAWVWCPTSGAFSRGEAAAYYPGDAYVDWICADGYASMGGRPYRDFGTIFDAFYRFGTEHGKPLMIGEFGVMERAPGEKAAWLASVAALLPRDYPQIKAILYFDSRRMDGAVLNDWLLTSSPQAMAAFRQLASNRYFNPPVPAGP